MTFYVKDLLAQQKELYRVRPDEIAQHALTIMKQHEFSQLPVVDSEGRLHGMITTESILLALTHLGLDVTSLHVRDALVYPQQFDLEDNLFQLLGALKNDYAVLVVDREGKLSGIVTNYDTAEYFRERAEDLMLVEDIEVALREHIRNAFRGGDGIVDENALNEAIVKALNRSSNFTKLTLWQYINLIIHDSQWPRYSSILELERATVEKLLKDICKTRNVLAHFREEITSLQRDQLKFCSKWLGNHRPPLQSGIQNIPSYTPIIPADSIEETSDPHLSTQAEIAPVEEDLGPTDSKYAPLAIFLRGQHANTDRIQLTFSQIEEIIGAKLPPFASEHRSWWANDTVGHVQSKHWLDVGWRVADINLPGSLITFARAKEREQAYISFFIDLLTELRKTAPFPIRSISPDGQNWINLARLPEKGSHESTLSFSFARGKQFRIELYIDSGSGKKDRNKEVFRGLFAYRREIEEELGAEVRWEAMEDRRASRIAIYHSGDITASPQELSLLREWAIQTMIKFREAIKKWYGK